MPPPPTLRSGQIYMKDAHCAESNEESICRFLFFKLWLFVFTVFGDISSFLSVLSIKKEFPSKVVLKERTKVTKNVTTRNYDHKKKCKTYE